MLCKKLATLLVLLFVSNLAYGQTIATGIRPIGGSDDERCEEMTVNYCTNIRAVNTVYLPNPRGHDSQETALAEFDDYIPLITNSDCSNGLYYFLCSYYFPLCYTDPLNNNRPTLLKPCRSLCEYVRPPCEAVLADNNLPWPVFLNCSLDDFGDGNTCFGPADPSTAVFNETLSIIIESTTVASTGDTSGSIKWSSASLFLLVFIAIGLVVVQ